MFEAESTVYKHQKAGTLYVSIPSKLATDSQFPFKAGDTVRIKIIDRTVTLEKVE